MLRRSNLLPALLALATIALPRPVHAESPPEPGAIERTIPSEIQQRAVLPTLSLPRHDARNKSSFDRRFTLGAVNIDGATVFSQQQLSPFFEAYLATQVDQSNLAQMAQAITAKYRHSGYLLSYAMVPQQNVEAGMARLSVVEGRVGDVEVQGAGAARPAIEAIVARLTNGGPLKNAELERTLGLIRDFPGLTVSDVALTRSNIDAGIYTLKVIVVPNRLRAFSYADNRGTGSVGRSRIYNSLAISSLAVPGDEYRVDLFAMPGGHSRYLYGQATAALPLGRSGLRLQLSASRGDQYLREDEHFNGRSDNVTAQLSYPMLRSRALTLVGKASFTDWRTTGSQADTRRLRDRLRVARMGIEFSNEGSTRFQGELLISRGLGFDGMTEVGDPLASRPDASGRFTKATLSAQVSRPLSDRLTLRATAAAQYSDRPVLSAEEFALGGNRLGRAYRFNARTGDGGAGAGVELGYRLGKLNSNQSAVELFGFADGGLAVDRKSSITLGDTRSIGSAGVGSRFSIGGMTVGVEAGVPLSGSSHRPRLFVSIFRSF